MMVRRIGSDKTPKRGWFPLQTLQIISDRKLGFPDNTETVPTKKMTSKDQPEKS